MSKATARPWRVLESNNSNFVLIETDDGSYAGTGVQIATVNRGQRAERVANAELIVSAVNSHDDAVALAKAVLDAHGWTGEPEVRCNCGQCELARKVLGGQSDERH